MSQTTPQIPHADLAKYLQCVVYDLNILANATELMLASDTDAICEVAKSCAMIKLRTIYDFFHRPDASDTLKRAWFDTYNPTLPQQLDRDWETWLNHQSINTYVVHLDAIRITKTVPQPKFSRGESAVLSTAVRLLNDAMLFVDSIVSRSEFAGLDEFGTRWLMEFRASTARLNGMAH